jgi:hypothetical protein
MACGAELDRGRLTLPRAITGDLTFCGWACMSRWRGGELNAQPEADMRLSPVQPAAIHQKNIYLSRRARAIC